MVGEGIQTGARTTLVATLKIRCLEGMFSIDCTKCQTMRWQ